MDAPQQLKYRVFISHGHADEEWAQWLHKAFETCRMPKRLVGRGAELGTVPDRIAPVFRDRDELLMRMNRFAEAEPMLVGSQAGMKLAPMPILADRGRLRLIELYQRWGKPEAVKMLRAGQR